MTSTLFTEWLTDWDKVPVKKNRKIVLLLDNAPYHPQIDTLKIIKLVFLPPNSTAVRQPIDQGIVYAVKTKYRSMLLNELNIFIKPGQ